MTCPWDAAEYWAWRQGPQWAALRHACFERDGYRCAKQGARCSRRLQAHHRVYRARPEETRLEDLVTLCERHHERAHAAGRPEQKEKPKLRERKPRDRWDKWDR